LLIFAQILAGMLQLSFIRNNRDQVVAGLQKKNFRETDLVDKIIGADEQRKQLQFKSDELLAKRNATSKEIGLLMGQGKREEADVQKAAVASLKESIDQLTQELASTEAALDAMLVKLPNLPYALVPAGNGAEDKRVLCQVYLLMQFRIGI
jgi:seryl-tRNA synthetase